MRDPSTHSVCFAFGTMRDADALTSRVTTAHRNDDIVSDDDIPLRLGDAETAKYLEGLGSVYESRGGVLTDGSGGQVGQEPAFPQIGHDP